MAEAEADAVGTEGLVDHGLEEEAGGGSGSSLHDHQQQQQQPGAPTAEAAAAEAEATLAALGEEEQSATTAAAAEAAAAVDAGDAAAALGGGGGQQEGEDVEEGELIAAAAAAAAAAAEEAEKAEAEAGQRDVDAELLMPPAATPSPADAPGGGEPHVMVAAAEQEPEPEGAHAQPPPPCLPQTGAIAAAAVAAAAMQAELGEDAPVIIHKREDGRFACPFCSQTYQLAKSTRWVCVFVFVILGVCMGLGVRGGVVGMDHKPTNARLTIPYHTIPSPHHPQQLPHPTAAPGEEVPRAAEAGAGRGAAGAGGFWHGRMAWCMGCVVEGGHAWPREISLHQSSPPHAGEDRPRAAAEPRGQPALPGQDTRAPGMTTFRFFPFWGLFLSRMYR